MSDQQSSASAWPQMTAEEAVAYMLSWNYAHSYPSLPTEPAPADLTWVPATTPPTDEREQRLTDAYVRGFADGQAGRPATL